MKFSILVPVYNVEKYIAECLNSLLGQTFKDFEIILVDDGSTDCSGEICDAYKSQYPDHITVIHTPNRGVMLSRRCAIQHAKGDIFVFVDSDDYVDVHLLERLNAVFESQTPDMVIYGFYRFQDGNNEDEKVIHLPYENFYTINQKEEALAFRKKFVIDHICTNMWQKAVRRSIVDIEQDYSQWKTSKCEDVIESFPLIECAEKIIFLDEPLYHYRKSDETITATVGPKDLYDYVMCTNRSLYYIDRWFCDKSVKSLYYAQQNLFYYNYLRNVYKRIKNGPGVKKEMCCLAKNVLEQEVIREIIREKHRSVRLLPCRVRLRIRLFDFFMEHQAWTWVHVLIKLNTYFER